ncbi:glycoside hydrolase family 18 protein [Durotheca rogersii]|uniref:glycoside hydrolase family 18 protein n=1 Tax=Durotheca rogersii TaxID=419775 RepID=UPI00221F4116|nr:glycoside hydrolase family 18 protein [Durotheca rogersii]KAI5862163.1 glycoside hydrolase family 18 protein [Durotheca rogersii]
MRGDTLWGLAQCLLWGWASGLEQRSDTDLASILSTTTVYVPTTIYACTPPPVISTSTGPNVGVGTTTASASVSPTSASSTERQPPKPTSPVGYPSPLPPAPFRGFRNAVYFTNWGINGSNFHPQELPVSQLTHIFYAFADIDVNGTVKSSDPAVDLERRYPRDWRQTQGVSNAYGAVKQLYLHKKRNRNLKTVLSIGGWNFSPKFPAVAATDTTRRAFAASAVRLVTDWGFDGIDVDWEFPETDADRDNYVKLLAACREAFDLYSLRHHLRYRFAISVASSAIPHNYNRMDLVGMDRYVDTWNLMAYDYSGSWDTVSGHQANVFAYGPRNGTGLARPNTDDAVRHYVGQGVEARKIGMGLPLYGRGFAGTAGLGRNYTGLSTGGPQPGVFYYRQLPRAGAAERYDGEAQAAYSYDDARRELVSYDNVRSAAFKAAYLRRRGLGGAFFWEASGDRAGPRSLVRTVAHHLAALDDTPNNLHYPTSRYHNIRWGMPGE